LYVLNLTVAESGVIPPAPVKQFVPLDADGAQPRVSFIIEYTVPKFSESRPRAARDTLLERVEGIECVSRDTGLRVGWRVRWLCAWRNRRMRRNSQYCLTLCLERTGCRRCQFIVCCHVLIKAVCIEDHLVAKDLVVTTQPQPITLRFRERGREQIEIKAGA